MSTLLTTMLISKSRLLTVQEARCKSASISALLIPRTNFPNVLLTVDINAPQLITDNMPTNKVSKYCNHAPMHSVKISTIYSYTFLTKNS